MCRIFHLQQTQPRLGQRDRIGQLHLPQPRNHGQPRRNPRQKPQVQRIDHGLYGGDGAHHPEIVHHQEAVAGQVALAVAETAGDQQVALDVEVAQAAAVGLQSVFDL